MSIYQKYTEKKDLCGGDISVMRTRVNVVMIMLDARPVTAQHL